MSQAGLLLLNILASHTLIENSFFEPAFDLQSTSLCHSLVPHIFMASFSTFCYLFKWNNQITTVVSEPVIFHFSSL